MRNFYDRVVAFVFILGLLVAGAGFAHAGPYEDALEKFTTDDYSDTADVALFPSISEAQQRAA